jgi:isohexenylglutaconyl-CoA hydratase
MSAMTPPLHTATRQGEGGVLHLTLNRPAVRNAMSLQMVEELRAALRQAEGDGSTRVIVLRGAGGHFCAGADLVDMAAARARLADDPGLLARTNAAFGELCLAYAGTGLATVAVLEGTVMGGGFGLACAVDVALAVHGVSFRLPECALGLVPAQIAPFLVGRLGPAEARRLAITAARLDAQQALALRLVHEIHAPDAIDAALAAVLADLRQCAPGAIASTKALMAKAHWQADASLIAQSAQVFAAAATGTEGIEGTMAFMHKRKPEWAR